MKLKDLIKEMHKKNVESKLAESIQPSTPLMAVKTLSKRQSITNARSRPLALKVRRRYIYSEETKNQPISKT